jgi:hypothetical protein
MQLLNWSTRESVNTALTVLSPSHPSSMIWLLSAQMIFSPWKIAKTTIKLCRNVLCLTKECPLPRVGSFGTVKCMSCYSASPCFQPVEYSRHPVIHDVQVSRGGRSIQSSNVILRLSLSILKSQLHLGQCWCGQRWRRPDVYHGYILSRVAADAAGFDGVTAVRTGRSSRRRRACASRRAPVPEVTVSG